jgi:hypothetical protein
LIDVDVEKLNKEIRSRKYSLLVKKGARDQLLRDKQLEEQSSQQQLQEAAVAEEAHLWVLTEIVERRDRAVSDIEASASATVEAIYGHGHGVKFEGYEEKRAKGDANFKMEIQYVEPYKEDGHEGDTHAVGVQGGTGGGAMESIGTWLRAKALDWRRYQGPLILDESWSALSRDGKLDVIAQLLRAYCDASGRQVWLATHMVDVFAPIADQVLVVKKVDEYGKVTVVTEEGFGEAAVDEDMEFES